MAIPLPEGTNIYIERKKRQSDYAMPSMEMATDHYSMGYVISGDRKTITPTESYSYHAGDVATSPPLVYHRTMAESAEPYERILIKYTPEYIRPFIDKVGQQLFDTLYEQRIHHFSKADSQKIGKMFMDMEEEFRKDTPYKEFILQGMLFRLLLEVWEQKLPDNNVEVHKTPLTPPIVEVIAYIEHFYAKDPSLEEAARIAGFSAAYFSRLFQSQLGMSYSKYLSNVKIRHVQILLTSTDKSIMEIAQETGYCHGNYLNEQFKKRTGMTPGAYRKMKSQ